MLPLGTLEVLYRCQCTISSFIRVHRFLARPIGGWMANCWKLSWNRYKREIISLIVNAMRVRITFMSPNPECGQDASVLICVLNTTAAKELKKLKMQDYRSGDLQCRIAYTLHGSPCVSPYRDPASGVGVWSLERQLMGSQRPHTAQPPPAIDLPSTSHHHQPRPS